MTRTLGHQIYYAATEASGTVRSIYEICGGAGAEIDPLVRGFWVQNKHASEALYIQADNTAASNENIQVDAGVTYAKSGNHVYDIREYFVRVATTNNPFSIELDYV